MGKTTRYRFREYTVTTVLDPMALPTFEAVCVTGEDQDCGAASGQMHTPEALDRRALRADRTRFLRADHPRHPPCRARRVEVRPPSANTSPRSARGCRREQVVYTSDGSSDGNNHAHQRITTDPDGPSKRR
jgi:hypothetical protein